MMQNPEGAKERGHVLMAADGLRAPEILEEWDDLTPEDRGRLLGALEPEVAAEVLVELPAEEQATLLEAQSPGRAREILEAFDPDDLADALQRLAETAPEHLEAIEALLSPGVLAVVEELAGYDEEEAGGLMTPEFVRLRASSTVEQALTYLRQVGPDAETVYADRGPSAAHRAGEPLLVGERPAARRFRASASLPRGPGRGARGPCRAPG